MGLGQRSGFFLLLGMVHVSEGEKIMVVVGLNKFGWLRLGVVSGGYFPKEYFRKPNFLKMYYPKVFFTRV